jgi:hypothetical protein
MRKMHVLAEPFPRHFFIDVFPARSILMPDMSSGKEELKTDLPLKIEQNC